MRRWVEINVCEQIWTTWLDSSVHNKWISTLQTFSSTLFVQKPWIFCHSLTSFLNNTYLHTLSHTYTQQIRNIWWNRWATWKREETTYNTHFRYHRRWLLKTILHIITPPAEEYNNHIHLIYMYKNNNTRMKLHKHEKLLCECKHKYTPILVMKELSPGSVEKEVKYWMNRCIFYNYLWNMIKKDNLYRIFFINVMF